jgi:putative spermidine/putrescine transport system permease protein
MDKSLNSKRVTGWALLWTIAALLYFFVPIYGTLDFSLRMKRGEISLMAYQIVFSDPRFLESFRYSALMVVITIIVSVLIFVPTVYWIYLKLPHISPVVEIINIIPFIVPAVSYKNLKLPTI